MSSHLAPSIKYKCNQFPVPLFSSAVAFDGIQKKKEKRKDKKDSVPQNNGKKTHFSINCPCGLYTHATFSVYSASLKMTLMNQFLVSQKHTSQPVQPSLRTNWLFIHLFVNLKIVASQLVSLRFSEKSNRVRTGAILWFSF